MKTTFYLLVAFLVISACKPTDVVKFTQPQPESGKPVSEFGRNIQGTYTCMGNPDDELTVGPESVINTFPVSLSFLRSELKEDSIPGLDIHDDQQIIKTMNDEGWHTTIRQDSIFLDQTETDTLFMTNSNRILKRFAGSYFLNSRTYDNYWTVMRMELLGDTLFIGEIFPSDTLLRYDFVSKTNRMDERDSIVGHDYILNPERRDLRKMIHSGDFTEVKKYVRKKIQNH